MNAIRAVNRHIDGVLKKLLAIMFALMIIVVFVQVFSRNLLETSFIGILDIAQLLFSWCIFIGAALALRRDAHYNLDLIPEHWHSANACLKAFGHSASLVVVYVLAYIGLDFTLSSSSQEIPSLEISGLWLFLPIPIGGIVMGLFLIEMIPDEIRQIRADHAERNEVSR